MEQKITVGLDDRSYPIWIGSGLLDHVAEKLDMICFPQRVAVISNTRVFDLYGNHLTTTLVEAGIQVDTVILPDGEEYKDMKHLQLILDSLIQKGFDRGCGLIALGGGVIGDMAGFAAAIFLRGIPFFQIPTTLLSQVDSSVGGKTAVNHPLGKNMIGAFYQPQGVLIDVKLLSTLEEREFLSGTSEVIKYGMIYDADFFDWLDKNVENMKQQRPQTLMEAVKRSCQIKANVVEVDERETSYRAILNFGHTFGHAVENLTGYGTVKHGEAVAIGMVAAAELSLRLGLSTVETVERLQDVLRKYALPVTPPVFPLNDYMSAMKRDKKVKQGTLNFVVNENIGHCRIMEIDQYFELLRDIYPDLP